jgi:phosphoribosylformylglycinamidine (FGAM) synthase-like amidotransferase family enzyme
MIHQIEHISFMNIAQAILMLTLVPIILNDMFSNRLRKGKGKLLSLEIHETNTYCQTKKEYFLNIRLKNHEQLVEVSSHEFKELFGKDNVYCRYFYFKDKDRIHLEKDRIHIEKVLID